MNMDEDEVTREPFDHQDDDDEETGFISTWEQPRYDSDIAGDGFREERDGPEGPAIEAEEDLIEDDSTSLEDEDVEYARKFGIELKNSKLYSNYQRLINSDQLSEPAPPRGRLDEDEPIIKTSITSDCIYHKGCFYQKGDIVALCDQDDGQIYFAQLTGFLQDQYCEKSSSINWLTPIRPTSRKFFDPSAYRLGMEDVQLRKLDCMTFVCRCPHDYYLKKFFQSGDSPVEDSGLLETTYTNDSRKQTYIWTSLRTCSVPTIETNKT